MDYLNKWIPVNKNLPVIGGSYLVTVKGRYAKSTLTKYSKFYNGKFDTENVIAWMPLPLPYRF